MYTNVDIKIQNYANVFKKALWHGQSLKQLPYGISRVIKNLIAQILAFCEPTLTLSP